MKKKLKFVILFIVIALAALIVYGVNACYMRAAQSINGGENFKGNKTISVGFSSKYRYVFLELKASASSSGKIIKYYIINPSGTIMDKGDFSKDGGVNISKRYPGAKGTWKIKFEASDPDENIGCTYLLATANNKNAIGYYGDKSLPREPVH